MRRALVIAGLLLVAACSRAKPWPPKAAHVHLGEDACAACRMIISDPRHGAQLHHRDGRVLLFDDLGCLLGHVKERPELEAIFVRSLDGEAWVRGDRAFVVRGSGIDTPMGSGLVGFGDRAAAEAAAARTAGASVEAVGDLFERRGGGTALGMTEGRR